MKFLKSWFSGPVLWFAGVAALLVTWAVMEPTALVHAFDQDGYSPFELATLPFFAAIVPLVWWKCPFTGSKRRRVILCLAVSLVALMAIVKEMDLHNMVLHALCPDYVGEDGKIIPGVLFKPNGQPLSGTPSRRGSSPMARCRSARKRSLSSTLRRSSACSRRGCSILRCRS